jgi:hypothetical protein
VHSQRLRALYLEFLKWFLGRYGAFYCRSCRLLTKGLSYHAAFRVAMLNARLIRLDDQATNTPTITSWCCRWQECLR